MLSSIKVIPIVYPNADIIFHVDSIQTCSVSTKKFQDVGSVSWKVSGHPQLFPWLNAVIFMPAMNTQLISAHNSFFFFNKKGTICQVLIC